MRGFMNEGSPPPGFQCLHLRIPTVPSVWVVCNPEPVGIGDGRVLTSWHLALSCTTVKRWSCAASDMWMQPRVVAM